MPSATALAIERVREAEARTVANSTALTEAAARSLFTLMAYKDEYEVGRLYTNGHFEKQVAAAFEGENLRYEFHLAPPLLARRDKTTGLPRKMSFGPWMLKAFAVLAKLKGLRGTPFDVFGYTHERKVERRLIGDYEALLGEIVATLAPQNHAARGRPRATCRRRSAASATSRPATSRRQSERRPSFSPVSARRRRRCRSPRSSVAARRGCGAGQAAPTTIRRRALRPAAGAPRRVAFHPEPWKSAHPTQGGSAWSARLAGRTGGARSVQGRLKT